MDRQLRTGTAVAAQRAHHGGVEWAKGLEPPGVDPGEDAETLKCSA